MFKTHLRIGCLWAIAIVSAGGLAQEESAQTPVVPDQPQSEIGIPQSSAQQPMPSDAEIIRMRRALQARARELEEERRLEAMAPLERLSRGPALAGDRRAAICLTSELDHLRAIWSFEPIGRPELTPVCAPQVLKGEQWIALTPGKWRLRLIVGHPAEGYLLRPPQREIELKAGESYGLELTERLEGEFDRDLKALKKVARQVLEADEVKETFRPASHEAKPVGQSRADE